MIRSLFLPEEGCTWGCFDYSQQEPSSLFTMQPYIIFLQSMMLLILIKMMLIQTFTRL